MSVDLAALPEIVATLPEKRRERVMKVLQRERAAVRIKDVYPPMLKRYQTERAKEETARALRSEGFDFVTARWVQSVMREKR